MFIQIDLPLFDSAASDAAKAHGMQVAAEKKPLTLEFARKIALEICSVGKCISIDDVLKECEKRGVDPNLGAASGSLFKTPDWRFTGIREKSTRVSNHSREIKVWQRITNSQKP
jgi:hypothetical protein